MILVLDPELPLAAAADALDKALAAPPFGLSALGTIAGDGTASALAWSTTTGPARAVV